MGKASPDRGLCPWVLQTFPVCRGRRSPRTALPGAGLLGGPGGVSVLGPEMQTPETGLGNGEQA